MVAGALNVPVNVRADIDVIIVHYHAALMLRDAVDAIRRDAWLSGLSVRILVADNGSTEAERELIRSLDVVYIPTGSDAGYAGGANFAYPQTTAECVVLMNEDVMVLPGCLAALRKSLLDGASVAGPEFAWDRDGIFLLPCTEERTRKSELTKVSGRRSTAHLARARAEWRAHARRHWESAVALRTTAISGALLAFRRGAWDTVGPFDEGFQMYFDENDWLLRMEASGLPTVYVPSAKAIHLHNPKLGQDDDRQQWAAQSFLRFGNRHYGETFMRRLFRLGTRPQAMPEWELVGEGTEVTLELPRTGRLPLWIELTPSPLGFPAAATRVSDGTATHWTLRRLRGLDFLAGSYYLTIVDQEGRELRNCAFRWEAPSPQLQLATAGTTS